jgi:hypothetical protein
MSKISGKQSLMYIRVFYVRTQSFIKILFLVAYVEKTKKCIVNSHIGALKVVYLTQTMEKYPPNFVCE